MNVYMCVCVCVWYNATRSIQDLDIPKLISGSSHVRSMLKVPKISSIYVLIPDVGNMTDMRGYIKNPLECYSTRLNRCELCWKVCLLSEALTIVDKHSKEQI